MSSASRPHIVGVVLAGGQSRRFGADKALVRFGGARLIDWSVEALLDAGVLDVTVIGRTAPLSARGDVRVVADLHPGGGPAPAIAHALRLAPPVASVAVLSCDLPAIDGPAVGRLLRAHRYRSCRTLVVATREGRPQWTASVWPPRPEVEPVRWVAAPVRSLAEWTGATMTTVELGAAVADVDAPADLECQESGRRGGRLPAMAIQEIDVAELDAHLASGGALLDVRSVQEFAEGHVPGAVLISLDVLAERLNDVPDGSPLAVICRSGARSLKACEFLHEQGREAVNVVGGTLAWVESGRPTETGSAPS